MKRTLTAVALSAVLMLTVAAPAFAATGSDFGAHHATHAIEKGGFNAEMNPGMHQGLAGWTAP